MICFIASRSWMNLFNLDVIMNYKAGQLAPQPDLGQSEKRNQYNHSLPTKSNPHQIKSTSEKLSAPGLPILVEVRRQYNQLLQI